MDSLITLRPDLLSLSSGELRILGPYFIVFVGSVLALFLGFLKTPAARWITLFAAMGALVFAMIQELSRVGLGGPPLFNGMFAADAYSALFNLIFMSSAFFTVLFSSRLLNQEKLPHSEYCALLLLSVLGMMFMAAALDLIVLFIALELMSISVYVLVGFRRNDRRCNEAALKYFIIGAVASAFFLYGVALLYGAAQSTNIRTLLTVLRSSPGSPGLLYIVGAALVAIGFLFKVASVPFHMWTPDVYEGAPTPISGFMATGLKAAAFAAFIRVFVSLGYGEALREWVQSQFHNVLWVCAALTMVVGNVVALTQTNLKRMLAYSSIAHTGYLLVGVLSGAHASVLVYLVVYALMNLGAFGVLSLLATQDDAGVNLYDISGLAARRPWLAFAMMIFLLSLAGIPPTGGFMAKYFLFYSAVAANEIVLTVIGVLCCAISVYYYLRVLVYMYMREAIADVRVSRLAVLPAAGLAVIVVLIFQVGILPAGLIAAAKRAVIGI